MQQVFGPGRADSQVQFEQTRPRVLALLASAEFVHPHTLKQERSPTYSHEVQIYPVFQRRKHTNLPILYSIIFLDVFFSVDLFLSVALFRSVITSASCKDSDSHCLPHLELCSELACRNTKITLG